MTLAGRTISARRGFCIFRADNDEVYENLNGVLAGLIAFIADGVR